MIGKLMKGATFKGCIKYVLGKDKAELLDSDGLLTENLETIISGFNTQRLLNPRIKQPVGHISLAYSVQDKDKLDNSKMKQLAHEYIKAMGIENTQYMIVRHNDSEHPHVHIVYNRIDNNGRTISDKNDHYRNEKVCKMLKEKHSLYFGKGKDNVKQHRLKGNDKTKYQIYQAVKDTLPKSKNWKDLEKNLQKEGVSISYRYKGNSNEIQGISFTKNEVTFKGSEIDRSFSFSKLNEQLNRSNQTITQKESIQPTTKREIHIPDTGLSGLFSLNPSPTEYNDPYDPFKKRKKKKKKGLTR